MQQVPEPDSLALEEHHTSEYLRMMLYEHCSHGHIVSLEGILSMHVILQAVPCASCITRGSMPPFCFDCQRCLLFFSEDGLKKSRAGTLKCPDCETAGVPSVFRILDIIAPEVFIRYNWGRNRSTQNIVAPMRLRIEQNADVIC